MSAQTPLLILLDQHIVPCTTPTRGMRVLDMLNDPGSEYLRVENVDFSQWKLPAQHQGDHALLRKEAIRAVVLPDSKHEAPEKRHHARVAKKSFPAVLVAGQCIVQGRVHTSSARDERTVLSQAGSFLPMTDAVVTWRSGKPTRAAVILVQRASIGLLSVDSGR